MVAWLKRVSTSSSVVLDMQALTHSHSLAEQDSPNRAASLREDRPAVMTARSGGCEVGRSIVVAVMADTRASRSIL